MNKSTLSDRITKSTLLRMGNHPLGKQMRVKCGKRFKGKKFAKTTAQDPVAFKSPGLNKGGYLEGSYPKKVK